MSEIFQNKYQIKFQFLSTFFLVISTFTVILNWSLIWISLFLNLFYKVPNHVFHPIISGFESQSIWSIFFFVLSVICGILGRKISFENWFSSLFAPFLFFLTAYGIFGTVILVFSSGIFSLPIIILTALFLIILTFKTKIFSILTFSLILIPICVNLLGANATKTFLFEDGETQKVNVQIFSLDRNNNTIYKNIFYKIIWQKEDVNKN